VWGEEGAGLGGDGAQVGPISDKGIYDTAKNFAEKIGRGDIQAKPESQEILKTESIVL